MQIRLTANRPDLRAGVTHTALESLVGCQHTTGGIRPSMTTQEQFVRAAEVEKGSKRKPLPENDRLG